VLIDTGIPHASVYMLEIDEDSRLGRELISGGARYSAGLVPTDDAIAQMYEEAIAAFASAGLEQYEISNFAHPGSESKHNLRYWQRRPYLGVGLDASSMLRASDENEVAVLRATSTDDLTGYLSGNEDPETAWLGPTQQLEEAWFLGLRRNTGVTLTSLRQEFGSEAAEPTISAARRLAADGLLSIVKDTVKLTDRGRLISNDVFAEFIGLGSASESKRVAAIAN
jgi:oxygen-independent coproporphyrinogen-3 oxidase